MSEFISFRWFFAVSLLLVTGLTTYAQDSEEEKDLKEKAEKLFEDEKYVEATTMYVHLLALNPRSYDYNFRYGTCLIYNSYKKQDAFKYLTFAVKDPQVDPRAYYFLGKAFHLNYQFNEAIKNYEIYKQRAGEKIKASLELDRQIEMCQNGKRLLTTITDLVVLEKKEIDIDKFFRLYDLRNIGGDFLVASNFQSKVDKKKGFTPLIHFPANSSRIYYASYGETDKGHKDIYVRTKLPDGSWSLAQPVEGKVNSKYDEDFPYMNPNGSFLYFCSKGHNSMGGYDVFRSRYDSGTNSFGAPENMDFAISSPDNDMLYVVDSLDNNAYFASSRQSANGKIYVYKVRVDRVPLQLAVIKGAFNSTINPENKKISISVTDYASGEKTGTFASNETGGYLITFPKGGKYTYEMKVDGSNTVHKYLVTIPFLKEFRPLKQKIVQETAETGEVVKVIDLFNEEVDDPVGVMAEVIKMQSELNPNANKFDLSKLDIEKENARILAELGFADAGPQQIVSAFENMHNDQEERVRANESLVNGALTSSMVKLEEAEKLQEEARLLVNRSTNTANKTSKYEMLSEAQDKMTQAAQDKSDVRSLMAFADSVSKILPKDQEMLAAIDAITTEVKKEVLENNPSGLKEIIKSNTQMILSIKAADKTDPIDALIEEKIKKTKEREKLLEKEASYISSEEGLAVQIKTLEESLKTARQKDQEDINNTINSKKMELSMVQDERKRLGKKIDLAGVQEKEINDRVAFLQNITDVKDAAKVAPQEVQNKLNAVDTKNNSSLSSFINQQIEDLKKDPNVRALADAKDPEKNYQNQVEAIKNNTALSETQKITKLLQEERKFEAYLDAEIAKTAKAFAQAPTDEKVRQRKVDLASLKAKTSKNIADYESQLKASGADTKINTDVIVDVTAEKKRHEDVIADITGKTALSEKNKVTDLLTEETKWNDYLNDESVVVAGRLNKNPNDAQSQQRKAALDALKKEAQQQVDKRTKELAALPADPSTTTTAEKETDLKAANAAHESRVMAISANSALSKKDKANQILADEARMTALIDTEMVPVADKLAKIPNDVKAKQRKSELDALRVETNKHIAEQNRILGSLEETTTAVTPETTTEQLTDLKAMNAEHSRKIAAISADANLSAKEKVNQVLADEARMNTLLDAEMALVNDKLAKIPNDVKFKQRKSEIDALKVETAQHIAEQNRILASLKENPVATTTETVEEQLTDLRRANAEHERTITRIAADTKLAPKERAEQILADEARMTALIDAEMIPVTDKLAKIPNDVKAKQRKSELDVLRVETNKHIAEQNRILASLEEPISAVTPETTTEQLTDLKAANAEHERTIAQITADTKLTPKERAERILADEARMNSLIDAEMVLVNEKLARISNDTKAKQRKTELEALKAETAEHSAEQNRLLAAASTTSTTPDAVIKGDAERALSIIAPTYKQDIKNATGASPEQALTAKNAVDQRVLDRVKQEMTNVNQKLSGDPKNVESKTWKASLELLQTKMDSQINERNGIIATMTLAGTDPVVPATPDADKRVKNLVQKHQQEIAAINKKTNIPATVKVERILVEEAKLVTALDEEAAINDNILAENPQDQAAIARQKELTTLKSGLTESISEHESQLAVLNENPGGSTLAVEAELATLAPTYQSDLAKATGGTPLETLRAKNRVDTDLKQKIDKEAAKVDQQLKATPNDPKSKNRKNNLEQLNNRINSQIAGRDKQVAELVDNQDPFERELDALYPGYRKELEAASGATPVETLVAKNAVDKKLAGLIDNELEKVTNQLEENPGGSDLRERSGVLDGLKDQTAAQIIRRDRQIADLTNTGETRDNNEVAAVAKEIRPEYAANKLNITKTTATGSAEQERALLKEEKALLASMETEISKLEERVLKNPDDAALREKADRLKEAQTLQEAAVNERELDLVALEKSKINPEKLQSEIAPDYKAMDMTQVSLPEIEITARRKEETKLQAALIKRKTANDRKLAKGFDAAVAAENKVIESLLDQSTERVQLLTVASPTADTKVAELDPEVAGRADMLMNAEPKTLEEAKTILKSLNDYQIRLNGQLATLENTPKRDEIAITQKNKQIAAVRKRIGVIEFDLDELNNFKNTTSSETASKEELSALDNQEKDLADKLENTDLTSKEKKTVTKELLEVKAKQDQQKQGDLKEELVTSQVSRQDEEAALSAKSADNPLGEVVAARATDLTAKNPDGAKKGSYADQLEEQVKNEQQALTLLETTNAYLDLLNIFKKEGVIIENEAGVKDKKRRFSIEIGQLEAVLQKIQDDPAQKERRSKLEKQKKELEEAVGELDKMLAILEKEQSALKDAAKLLQETTVSYEEEIQIVSSPNYPKMFMQNGQVKTTQRQLRNIGVEKEKIRKAIAEVKTPEERRPLITKLKEFTADELVINAQLADEKSLQNVMLELEAADVLKLRNVLAREVPPVSKSKSPASELLPAMAGGFNMSANPVKTVRAEKVLPVDLKLPDGLVYRVQVGAFSKPIPEELFSEFTPVTGEKLSNGIIRYMAGYFGSRTKVIDARKQIRSLGYADAFIVAYCDGKRITLDEARRLEDAGLCVPKDQDSIIQEMVQNTLAKLPQDTIRRVSANPKISDYNKAPGAVQAEAVEERMGLFYTVQIGVYNKPVPAEQVKNITPLITKRLDNGQIRYSSGVFSSPQAAQPKRAEAIERGVTDAFITAYYKGERISLTEAQRILAEKGESVLENANLTVVKPTAIEDAKAYVASQPVIAPTEVKTPVQIVSRKQYPTAPREILNRYNDYGSFYYDSIDQRVKSASYTSKEELPSLAYLKTEVDTLSTSPANSAEEIPELKDPSVVAEWGGSEMTGEFGDWLLRLSIPHVGEVTKTGYRLRFDDVAPEQQGALIYKLKFYGAKDVKTEEIR